MYFLDIKSLASAMYSVNLPDKDKMETFYLIEVEWRIYALPTLAIIDANNSLCVRHQAVIWTNAAIVLIGPFETNFS